MRPFILAVLVLLVSGCSVGMAMSGTKGKDTSILFMGAPRDGVIAKLGPPETSVVEDNGNRTDTYMIMADHLRIIIAPATYKIPNIMGTQFSIIVSGLYNLGSFPSPNAFHSAAKKGLDGSRFSNSPITLYFAVFNCLYDFTILHHEKHKPITAARGNNTIHLFSSVGPFS